MLKMADGVLAAATNEESGHDQASAGGVGQDGT